MSLDPRLLDRRAGGRRTRTRALRGLAPALAACLLAASAIAHAQPAPDAPSAPARSQEDRERANALMDEGDAHVEKGDLTAALTAYRSAHAIMGVPTTGIEVARTLDRLGRLKEALAAARAIAASPTAPGEPKPFTDAREQAKTLVTALEARVPTLAIQVTIATRGARAQVTLDGKQLAPEDLQAPLVLDPGRYRVAATADDHTPASVEITLKERDRAQAALALARVVVAPPPLPARPPPPPAPSLSPLVPIGFSAAGAFALAGAITGALAISAANEANNLCPAGVCASPSARTTAQGRYDTADALAIAADVSFGLVLAGAAAGIYGIAISIPSPEPAPPPARPASLRPPKPGVALVVAPGRAGLTVSF